MQCAVHLEAEAPSSCAVCHKNLCDACAAFDVDSAACCERCGVLEEQHSQALSSGLLALVAVGYLATLAIGILLFKPRPFVGGLAAIAAIALGRGLQMVVKTPVVTRRFAGR